MCDLMLSSPNDNEQIKLFAMFVINVLHMCGKNRLQFFNIKIPLQNGHTDILKVLI